jgi:O-antigen ligase
LTEGLARRAPGAVGLALLAGSLAWAPTTALLALSGGAGLLLAMLLPALALALVALAIPFGPLAGLALGTALVTPAPLLLGLAAAGRIGRGLLARRAWRLPARWLGPFAAFLAVLGASAWFAPDVVAASVEIARWVALALALWLAAGLAGRPRALRVVIVALLIGGSLEALAGVQQAQAGLGPLAFAAAGGRTRAFGHFGQPNPFGGYMNMVWPLGLALALPVFARVRNPTGVGLNPGLWLRIAGLAAFALAICGLWLSWSRGAWLAAVAALFAMALVAGLAAIAPPLRLRWLLVGTLATAAALACLLVLPAGRLSGSAVARLGSVADTFAIWDVADVEVNDANFATVERVAHWQAAFGMWADRPWLGQAPGHFELAYPRYRLARWSEPLGHAHNIYLQQLAEAGLLGLAGFLLFGAWAVWLALRAAWLPHNGLHAALGLGLVGLLAALAVHSLTDNLFVHDLTIQLGLLLGLTVAAAGQE